MATGPLTWKNVPQTSDGAILGTINDAAASIGRGISGVGDAFTQYSDNRSTQETNEVVAALTMASNDADRDAIMQSMDPNSFVDLGLVADAYKEANIVADPSWEEQQKILSKNALALQYVKNKDSFKEGKHNYSPSGIASEVTKLYPDAENTSLWGVGNLWGETTPAADAQNRISAFISDMGMNDKEAKRAVKTLLGNTTYDTTGRNEVFINNGQMDTTIDDATDEQLTNILIRGGYLSDAEKDKQKTNTK